jgi:PAS domain S-box-containing protein
MSQDKVDPTTGGAQTEQVYVDLQEARASLRATEQHFRLLVERVRDYAIFLLDPQGRVATWNLGAQRIKGYSAAEIIGHHFSKFYLQEEIDAGKCEMELEVAAREGRFEDLGWRKRKDGTLFWANVVITGLRDDSNELIGYAKVTRDLTEPRKAEEERIRLIAEQKAREAADTANRAKDEFLAHISHELRTPLNAILGWARLLQSGLDEERRARATATIERNAEAMAQLIDDLLDVSRIISGKMRLDVVPVDVALVIERAIESVRLSADAKEIHLQATFPSAAAIVMGDSNRLQQVIWNLLSNAVKFTNRGGQVYVQAQQVNHAVEISVRDTGMGIPEDKLRYVFEPFWQGNSGPTTGSRGLGLGLAICRTLVEVHGGRIEARSEGHGHGTTFTISLPVAKPQLQSHSSSDVQPPSLAEEQQRQQTAALPQLIGLRVLVVEDEDDARDLVRLVLEDCGSIVTTASNVTEAFASIEREPPDVLVSDIGLPGGESGYDLIRRVRALPPERGGNIPAAAMTAYARGEDRLRALAAGFIVHVAKPIEPTELVTVVAALAAHMTRRPTTPRPA